MTTKQYRHRCYKSKYRIVQLWNHGICATICCTNSLSA